MSVLARLWMLYKAAESLAPDLPTEEMFLQFSEDVIDRIEYYIEEVEEAES